MGIIESYIYTGPLYLGTPLQGDSAQPYIYSTGSAKTSVVSATCAGTNVTGGYDLSNSSTAVEGAIASTSNKYYDGSGNNVTD